MKHHSHGFVLTKGVLLTGLCAGLFTSFFPWNKLMIARDGQTRYTIVYADQAAKPEEKALQELTNYLAQVTGASFPVAAESALSGEVRGIYVGWTKFAAANGIDAAKLGDEEWIIRSAGKDLIITGGRPRGTLYAVYHFLEDDLGVRWWTPQAESVPRKTRLELGKLDRRGKPVFAYRDIYLVSGKDAPAFSARNRFSQCEYAGRYYGARILFGGPAGCHTLYAFLGKSDEVKKLFQEHPDWFPLMDGARKLDPTSQNGGAQTQLCLTNPELRKFFLERVRGFIKEDKAKAAKQGIQPPMFYAIDQNDCYDGFCKCDKCMEIVKREGAVSGLVLEFTNYIAENLKNETDATFLMMAQHVLEHPPKLMRALPNVGLRLCDTTSNMIQPWTHPGNAKHRANIDGWSKITDKIVIWDYMIHYGGEFSGINLPFPNARNIAPDLRYLAEHNGYGIFFEHEEIIRADMRDLKIWLEAKLAENPYLDYEALLNDFTDGFYGPAGQHVRQYLALLEKSADKAQAKLTYFPGASAFVYLDGAFVIPAMRMFDAAEKAVGNDPELLRRVRHARLSLDRAVIIKAGTLKSEWKKQGNNEKEFPIDPDQVLARYKQTWQDACEKLFPAAMTGWGPSRENERKTHEKFLDGLAKRKVLPVPEQFKDVPQDRLCDFNAYLFSTWNYCWKQVQDPSTVVGGAWKVSVEDVLTYAKNYPESGVDKFRTPFAWAVWPTMGGRTDQGTAEVPAQRKDGYNWYKLGSTFKLCKDSMVAVFTGFGIPLEGVVADNSDVGQEYEIWVSIKIEGPAFSPEGLPGAGNALSIDRAIVIQKTSNKDKK